MILIGLVLAVAFSGCLGGGTNETDNTSHFYKNVTLTENDTVVKFEFTTNPSTGYGWEVTANNTSILNETVNDITTASTNMTGAPGIHTFSYEAQSPGTVALNFRYERSFENNSTLEDLTFVIQVNADNTIEILSVTTPVGGYLPLSKNVTLVESSAAIKMVFAENPTTGYRWNVSMTPTDVLNMTIDRSEDTATGMPGAPSIHTWQFGSLKEGNVSLVFDHNRAFENGSTTETAVFELRTNADSTIEIRSISLCTKS
jgi:predicted secreted protein